MQAKQSHLRLKTSSWNIKIGDSLKKLDFVQSGADLCLFKRPKVENTLYIIVYVDDFLISRKDKHIKNITEELKIEYEAKNLGQVNYLK